MDPTTNGKSNHMMNGKSHHTSMLPPPPGPDHQHEEPMPPPAPAARSASIEQVLTLANEIVNLEAQFNAKMAELSQRVKNVEGTDLPKLLVALMKQPHHVHSAAFATIIPPPPRTPTQEPESVVAELVAEPVTPTQLAVLKNRIMDIMDDGRERKAEVIIKMLKAKRQKSLVYSALTELIGEEKLVRPAYAHYRKKRV